GFPDVATNPWFQAFDSIYGVSQEVMNQYRDSMLLWHEQARMYADTFTNNGAYGRRAQPGTPEFERLKDSITSRTLAQGGTKFYDKSKLVHIQGEYKWDIKKKGQEKNWFDLTTGASFRMYLPNSHGAIFSDTLIRIDTT